MLYRSFVFRSGIRDPTPSMSVSDLGFLWEAVQAAIPAIMEAYPDVTEISIEDHNFVEYYRVRLRPDQQRMNFDELC